MALAPAIRDTPLGLERAPLPDAMSSCRNPTLRDGAAAQRAADLLSKPEMSILRRNGSNVASAYMPEAESEWRKITSTSLA
jgi:hypothetical protein